MKALWNLPLLPSCVRQSCVTGRSIVSTREVCARAGGKRARVESTGGCPGGARGGEDKGLTDSRDSGDDLAELELVEDGRLSGGIESDHEDTHLLLAEKARDYVATRRPWGERGGGRGGESGGMDGRGETWRVRTRDEGKDGVDGGGGRIGYAMVVGQVEVERVEERE